MIGIHKSKIIILNSFTHSTIQPFNHSNPMHLLNKLLNPRLLRFILPVSGVAIISRTFTEFSFIYYALPLLLVWFIGAAWKYFSDKEFKILVILILISGSWNALTSAWSGYPLISLSRAGYFVLLSLGMTSAGFLSMKERNNSPGVFLLPANLVVIGLCLFSFMTDIPDDTWTGGHGKGFMSFAGHQNLLASAILFTVPSSVYFFLVQKAPAKFLSRSTLTNFLSVLFLLMNILFLIMTYSRASLACYVIMIMLFGIFLFKWKAAAAYIIVAGALAALFFYDQPFRESAEKALLKDFPTILFSREILVEPSYHAALKGGSVGLGYGISDPEIILEGITGSRYIGGRYIREKGNSVLALTEETGFIGLILFAAPVIFVIKKFFSSRKANEDSAAEKAQTQLSPALINSFLFSVIIALIIHAQFEAWWVGPGSVQLPLFFIYLGALAAPREPASA